jgi:uncharacterized membrane protein YkoI
MFNTAKKTVAGVMALGALALGGSALATAATSGTTGTTGAAQSQAPAAGDPNGGRPTGPHVGANGRQEQALTGDTAAQVEAAALKKVDGTVERVETDADSSSPYEAHIRKSDGTEATVLVNKDFQVTSVETGR